MQMPKTVTIRLEDNIFNLFKLAAEGERRSISNFLEYATLNYLTNEIFVSDEEMDEITSDKKLMKSLQKSLNEVKKGKYKIVG